MFPCTSTANEKDNQLEIDTSHRRTPCIQIPVHIVNPFKAKFQFTLDTGSDLDAISTATAEQYNEHLQKGQLTINTGGGIYTATKYLPLQILHPHTEATIKSKFWVLEHLPHDWLLGRGTYQVLSNKKPQSFIFRHKPDVLDAVDLYDMCCSLLPTIPTNNIDLIQLNIKNPKLEVLSSTY